MHGSAVVIIAEWKFQGNNFLTIVAGNVFSSQSLFPVAFAFARHVVAGVVEVLDDFAAVGFVADFEEHFDSDATEWSEPHCAAVKDLDDIRSTFGDGF